MPFISSTEFNIFQWLTTIGCNAGSDSLSNVDVEVDPACFPDIERELDVARQRNCIPVITGFIARNSLGQATTLGRGGSDLSAVLFGVALHVTEIFIWTDTDGVRTADPRLVSGARTIPQLTFEEAAELAYFGAKILHPKSIQPAAEHNIPVIVRNSKSPNNLGTRVHDHGTIEGEAPSPLRAKRCNALLGMSCKAPVSLIDIRANKMLGQHGFLAEVFSVFRCLKISVDVIATSEISVSVTLDRDTPREKIADLDGMLKAVATLVNHGDKAIIALISDRSRTNTVLRIATQTLDSLDIPVEMVSLGASKLNTSIVIPVDRAAEAMQTLHSAFFSQSG